MSDVSRRLLICSIVFTLFFVVFPMVLGGTRFPLFPDVRNADVIEFFSPFFVIPAFWNMLQVAGKRASRHGEILVFLVMSLLFSLAIGMHFTSSAIQSLIEMKRAAPAHELAYFFHRPFSHYAMAIALIGLSATLIYKEAKGEAGTRVSVPLTFIAALLFGISFFAFTVSGKVALLGFVYSVLVAAYGIARLTAVRNRPMLTFFAMAFTVNLVLCAGWSIYWTGLPNFDEVEVIRSSRVFSAVEAG